jgi:hypothetical protein
MDCRYADTDGGRRSPSVGEVPRARLGLGARLRTEQFPALALPGSASSSASRWPRAVRHPAARCLLSRHVPAVQPRREAARADPRAATSAPQCSGGLAITTIYVTPRPGRRRSAVSDRIVVMNRGGIVHPAGRRRADLYSIRHGSRNSAHPFLPHPPTLPHPPPPHRDVRRHRVKPPASAQRVASGAIASISSDWAAFQGTRRREALSRGRTPRVLVVRREAIRDRPPAAGLPAARDVCVTILFSHARERRIWLALRRYRPQAFARLAATIRFASGMTCAAVCRRSAIAADNTPHNYII